MKTADIAAIAVVVLIAAAEFSCLFICSKLKNRCYPFCAAVPVFGDDKELPRRLEFIRCIIEDGSTVIGSLLIIDIDGNEEQLRLCREFCRCVECAQLIHPEDIEKYMKNNLHFK